MSVIKGEKLYQISCSKRTLLVHPLETNIRLTEIHMKSSDDVKKPTLIRLSEMQKNLLTKPAVGEKPKGVWKQDGEHPNSRTYYYLLEKV